ncbi:hypothetical protein GUJ93_ZPchr0009g947 [Zizania palustris]|uniref:GBF-interacting protein 1 N-terminal domain-containing protein n=1 Tax=Zizania palustris TaxID=103762 RepID=A0A8J5UY41_ZIZPA|nr:hypothetical protein GUJ93_ZPchr0009g947 [Zizania palustris]
MQGRGGKGGWGNYSSRQLSNSSDQTGRNAPAEKEIGVNPNMGKCSSSLPSKPNTDIRTSTSILSLSGGLSSGPSEVDASMEKNSLAMGQLQISDSKGTADLEETCTPALDLVLTPSLEVHSHSETGPTKHAFVSQLAAGESKVVFDDVSTAPQDTSRPGSSSIVVPSGTRPSSSCSSHAPQLNGSQKVIPNKEWKPKSANKPTHSENVICDEIPVTVETASQTVQLSISIHKEDIPSGVDKKLSDICSSEKQHVIIPDHLQVAESEKYGLSFGSFGTCFEQTSFSKDPESEKSSTPQYESSLEADEVLDELAPSHHRVSSTVKVAAEEDQQQLPAETTDNILPQKVDRSSSTPEVTESDQSKDAGASHILQDSVETTAPYPAFASAPHSQENQIPSAEINESQAQLANDISASYYAQLYRPIADGRLSPFTASGGTIKYGNMSVMPTQTGQAQELPQGINSLVLPSAGSTSLATPTSGVVPSSIGIPQQQFPVFRQPLGVHLPHYQPSFIPYNQYLSPFYVPQHALHHFMGNAVFPQPPTTGGMYSPVSAAVAPPVKYPTNSYKPGTNAGTQIHAGNPGAYGTYGSSPSVYTNNTAVVSGTSVENDDVSASQFKENNIYIAGQQCEGSTVWFSAPGRDISGLQPNSFYGLPPQGQHLAFAPAQAGHGTFGGMYHPAQTMAGASIHPILQPPQPIAGVGGEMVGPPANCYQQPQRAQMNWPNY